VCYDIRMLVLLFCLLTREYRALRENLTLNDVTELGGLLFVLFLKYRTLRENLRSMFEYNRLRTRIRIKTKYRTLRRI
jgi:hypothetical protein